MADTLLPTVGLNLSEGRFQSAQVNPQVPLWTDASKSYERAAAGMKAVQELTLAIKDYQDNTELNKALNEYHRAANAAYAQYAQLQGEDSVNGHADFGKTQDALLKEYGDRLEKAHPNLRARFDAQASRIKSGVLMNGDTVYAKNAFDLGIKERDAKVNLAAQDFSLNLGSPNEGQYLDLYSQAIDELADVYGIPKGSEAYKVFYQQNIDKGLYNAIDYQIDTANFSGASTALKRFEKTMSTENYYKLNARLQNKLKQEAERAERIGTLRAQRAAANSQRALAEVQKLYEPMDGDEQTAYRDAHYGEVFYTLEQQNPNKTADEIDKMTKAQLSAMIDSENAVRARMKTGAGVADTAIIDGLASVFEQTKGQPLTAEEIQDPLKIFERTQEGRQNLELIKRGHYQMDLNGLTSSVKRAFDLCTGNTSLEVHRDLSLMPDAAVAANYPTLDAYFLDCSRRGLPPTKEREEDIEHIKRVLQDKANGKELKGNSYYTDAVTLLSGANDVHPNDKTENPLKVQYIKNVARDAVYEGYRLFKETGGKGNLDQMMKTAVFKKLQDPDTKNRLDRTIEINSWFDDIIQEYSNPSSYALTADKLMRAYSDLQSEKKNGILDITKDELIKRLKLLNDQSSVKFLTIEDPDSYKYTYNHGKQNVKPSPRNSRNGTGGFVWGKGYYY